MTAEVLAENVLSKTDRMIVWWTPRGAVRCSSRTRKAKLRNSMGMFPQPPLVWRVSHGELNIRALCENKRPISTTLAVAPFWNLSDDGRVCLGPCEVRTVLLWQRLKPGSEASTRARLRTPMLADSRAMRGATMLSGAVLKGKRRPFPPIR